MGSYYDPTENCVWEQLPSLGYEILFKEKRKKDIYLWENPMTENLGDILRAISPKSIELTKFLMPSLL
jgi:hypothetical protein